MDKSQLVKVVQSCCDLSKVEPEEGQKYNYRSNQLLSSYKVKITKEVIATFSD